MQISRQNTPPDRKQWLKVERKFQKWVKPSNKAKKKKGTVLSTEAPVEPVEADLSDGLLTGAMVQSPLKFGLSASLLDAHPLQLVLMVQQSIHELVHLRGTGKLLQTWQN